MTGLIYVAIIAVWAIVLVPKWLKRHDRLDPQRSVHRFSRTMATLATRPTVLGIPIPEDAEQGSTGQAGLADPAPAAPEVVQVAGRRGARAADSARRAGGSTRRSGGRSRSAANRRRVVLGVLGAGSVVTLALVVLGLLSPLVLVLPVGLLACFVGVARHQVRSAAASAKRTQAEQAPARSTAPAQAARPSTPSAGATWEARQTPLPRYVTDAAAGDSVRGAAPGAWTAAAMLERAQQERVRAERMAEAKARAIAKAKEEQDAAESRTRDDEYLASESVWPPNRRAVNE